MPSKSIPEPWQSFLSAIDASLHEDVELHCLGGFVITVLYDLVRPNRGRGRYRNYAQKCSHYMSWALPSAEQLRSE